MLTSLADIFCHWQINQFKFDFLSQKTKLIKYHANTTIHGYCYYSIPLQPICQSTIALSSDTITAQRFFVRFLITHRGYLSKVLLFHWQASMIYGLRMYFISIRSICDFSFLAHRFHSHTETHRILIEKYLDAEGQSMN